MSLPQTRQCHSHPYTKSTSPCITHSLQLIPAPGISALRLWCRSPVNRIYSTAMLQQANENHTATQRNARKGVNVCVYKAFWLNFGRRQLRLAEQSNNSNTSMAAQARLHGLHTTSCGYYFTRLPKFTSLNQMQYITSKWGKKCIWHIMCTKHCSHYW